MNLLFWVSWIFVELGLVIKSFQKGDPAQFLQLHGRPMKIHVDPAVAAVADSPATMYEFMIIQKYLRSIKNLCFFKIDLFAGCLGRANQI